MKEKLLVLAKASPIVSKKYEELVCVGGITDKGEWRRIYPIPWKYFWKTSSTYFKKKSWIEYELKEDTPSNHRVESRKIISETINPLSDEDYAKIKNLLEKRLTTLEELKKRNHREISLGVIKPIVKDFVEEDSKNYEKLKKKKEQKTLSGKDAVEIDIAEKSFSYIFKCEDPNCKGHKILCEDWELAELYRKCEEYRKNGKYKDKREVFEKIKQRMLHDMLKKKEIYFILGTHYRFDTYIIIGIIYPRKSDKF